MRPSYRNEPFPHDMPELPEQVLTVQLPLRYRSRLSIPSSHQYVQKLFRISLYHARSILLHRLFLAQGRRRNQLLPFQAYPSFQAVRGLSLLHLYFRSSSCGNHHFLLFQTACLRCPLLYRNDGRYCSSLYPYHYKGCQDRCRTLRTICLPHSFRSGNSSDQ